ncbi:twin-arginine translocase TatA/TatE family subunit [Canibacter sp. lx-45]|uniref:twin-arginine translocase TatA/TatE family subunit n=1 Tax=Canibacter zhuwentaonis TaxID=2837491 RepID=UPI001BDBDFFA|nr:twin-arginine translocase TatA/TatE family subunit [Canibacter zhuwentaonis]MBT1034969.1 twin-arginine translocase TatA/TatE family subunit [Canibacter zhuwentaonis]
MGLTIEKIMIIVVIAVIILGPEKLPEYAQQLAQLVKNLRRLTMSAKERMREEMGEEFGSVDWKQYDPRQYDPRKIIRDAIIHDEQSQAVNKKLRDAGYDEQVADPRRAAVSGMLIADAAKQREQVLTNERTVPFDSEAT